MGSETEYKMKRINDNDETIQKLVATLAPVFDAQRQLLALMMELKVAQNKMETAEKHIAELRAELHSVITDRDIQREKNHERFRALEADLTKKAASADLKDTDKEAHKQEIKLARILTGYTIFSGLLMYYITRKP